jgi:hypothetical protein
MQVPRVQAELLRVGPVDVPSPPGNGYPFWYQDTKGMALDLCIPETLNQLDPCLMAPAPGAPPPTLPLAFPGNWPDEAFWFGADATIDLGGNNQALLVQALEAAFAVETPAVGDQISFGRIRIRVDAPVDGTYTITYPYGVKQFPDVVAGRRAINFTSDIGIGAPGDFTGALRSDIGPFLIPVNPPFVLEGHTFLSDGVTPTQVTGSPFDTNFFRVCVANAQGLGLNGQVGGPQCMETDLFTVIGRVHTDPIPSPLTVERATYSRNALEAKVDVFATAKAGPGAPTPVLSMADHSGLLMPSSLMAGPSPLGQYYGQGVPTATANIPPSVRVTNSADNPPSSVFREIVDEVTITQAIYDPAAGTLTITATSSDKVLQPELLAVGLPGSATGAESLIPTGSADTAEKQLTAFPVGSVMPPAVTVRSSAGGMDTESVVTVRGAPFPSGAPVAVDDNVSVPAGTTPITLNVLENDVIGAQPLALQIVRRPLRGTLTLTSTGLATYVPRNRAFVGNDSFTYMARRVGATDGLLSNVAKVTITTTDPSGGPPPIANPDGPFLVQGNSILQLNVSDLLANDSPNGGTINPNSFNVVAATGGTAVFNSATGVVAFNAGSQAGNFGFTYTIANTIGPPSEPAPVSITVGSATNALTITVARFRTANPQWIVGGTTATVPGAVNRVRVSLVRAGSVVGNLGTPIVDLLGNWSFRTRTPALIPEPGDEILAVSTVGGSATLPVRITR